MSWMLSTCKQALHRTLLTLCLVCALCLTSLPWAIQPAAAAPSTQVNQAPGGSRTQAQPKVENREAAYEAMAEVAKDPASLEKEYEKNLEAYEEAQPDKNVVEEAKELIEKVTGKE